MAEDNQENSGQSGQGRQQQKKPPNFPKCPICSVRPLPKEKQACLVCIPIYRIDAEATCGESKWQLVVETYKNEVQVNVPFCVNIDNKNFFIVDDKQKKYWKAPGLAVIPLDFSKRNRQARFSVIGGPAKIFEVDIPAEKSENFKWTEPDKGQGFWHNFRKGLRG
ncbi:MAG: hypothetical protein A3B89_04385 [Candidatus Buchananbacteria bacterium RIFCSPHIGHO2_02_FULL_40_13]|nr:MAG: hypothetical protein A2820_00355 [Candidatus Buchananbacteria bacterium RIFCSPHIGHO2_01_FULL_40_35]OGY49706.1 MAG: hypothetical protein A3B89_04385 [Candidatus Buchananbacteria bacterium RIFCSPHIGHO2_02_FULL_40_13]